VLQAARPSPLFLYTVSPKPHFSFKFIGVITDYLVTVIKESGLRVFEKRVLRRIHGPKMDEERRKLHNEELNNLYSSISIIRVIKSRRIRWTGHVSYMGGKEKCIQVFWWGNLRERGHLEDPSINGKIILKCIFRRWDVGTWTSAIWLRTGKVVGYWE